MCLGCRGEASTSNTSYLSGDKWQLSPVLQAQPRQRRRRQRVSLANRNISGCFLGFSPPKDFDRQGRDYGKVSGSKNRIHRSTFVEPRAMYDWAEFRHFRYLLAILERQGFRVAAEELHTSQQFIRRFRPGWNTKLTKVGIALCPALRALLAWAALRKEAMPPLHSHSSFRCLHSVRSPILYEGNETDASLLSPLHATPVASFEPSLDSIYSQGRLSAIQKQPASGISTSELSPMQSAEGDGASPLPLSHERVA